MKKKILPTCVRIIDLDTFATKLYPGLEVDGKPILLKFKDGRKTKALPTKEECLKVATKALELKDINVDV